MDGDFHFPKHIQYICARFFKKETDLAGELYNTCRWPDLKRLAN